MLTKNEMGYNKMNLILIVTNVTSIWENGKSAYTQKHSVKINLELQYSTRMV